MLTTSRGDATPHAAIFPGIWEYAYYPFLEAFGSGQTGTAMLLSMLLLSK
jgi:hypothetical protein